MSISAKAKNADMLVEQIHLSAANYCRYDFTKRQTFIDKGEIYLSIELWDGRFVTATPIDSCIGYGLDEIEDMVLMNGPDIKYAIEAIILCVLEGIKKQFVTETDCRYSKDILLWQLVKSS